MEDLPRLIVNTLGPVTALAFGIIIWLFILGTPVLFFAAIRFFWYRHVYIGRSKELEKLIWQMHRIATALEHQAGVVYPMEQPGTEHHDSGVHLSAFGR